MPSELLKSKMYHPYAGLFLMVLAAGMLCLLSGCGRFRSHGTGVYVYVLPREKLLKDHVAVLSNTTATVTNGEPLEVIEHSKRFIRVKTPKGEIGWIEDAAVVPQRTADAFSTIAEENKTLVPVDTATVTSESRMHIHPGRSEPWLYLMQRDDKLQLLQRAVVPKPIVQATPASATKAGSESGAGKATASTAKPPSSDVETPPFPSEAEAPAPSVPMEDWWLVRDTAGHTGWVLGRSLDVDVPNAMLKLGQGERFMGVYPLDTVHDDDSGITGVQEVPQYAVAYAASRSGLLYDFDKVVVYTWNNRKHRYETAFRDSNIEGFLPLIVTHEIPPNSTTKKPLPLEPVFRYKVLAQNAQIFMPQPDAEHPEATDQNLGVPHPTALVQKAYRLQGVSVIPLGTLVKADMEAHPEAEKKTEKKKKKK